MMEEIMAFFAATFFVWALMSLMMLNSIVGRLSEIRDDLREHFKAEGRRWSIDSDWRHSE